MSAIDRVREIFTEQWEMNLFIGEPYPMYVWLTKNDEVKRFREEVKSGRFTKEDLEFVLNSIFGKLDPGFECDGTEMVCGILAGITGTSIEGEFLTYFAEQRALEIGRISRLARILLKEKINDT
jgi:hypothetical protein